MLQAHLAGRGFTVLIAVGLAALSPAARAQVLWGANSAHFTGSSNPGDPNSLSGQPHVVFSISGVKTAADPSVVGALTDLPDGFKYSSATISYTTVASDINNNLTLAWQIQRSGEVQGGGTTAPNKVTSGLDGTLQYTSNILLSPSFSQDSYFITDQGNKQTATVSTTGYAPNTLNAFAQSSSGIVDVITNTNVFIQDFRLSFTPTAAGETLTLNLPSSSQSSTDAPTGTPEPSSIAVLGIGGTLLAVRGRRRMRRHRSRRDR